MVMISPPRSKKFQVLDKFHDQVIMKSYFNFSKVFRLVGALCLMVASAIIAPFIDSTAASASSTPLVPILPDSIVSTANSCTSGSTPLAARGVVFDKSGNAFISDTGTAGGGTCNNGSDNGGIWEVPYNGSNTWGSPHEVISFSSGNQPNGLAIDSAGNLYVADNGNSTIYEFVKQGTTQGYAQFLNFSCATSTTAPNSSCFQQETVAGNVSSLIGVAIAPDGSLYFADQTTGYIEHATQSSNSWTFTPTTITLTPNRTYAGIAVSSSGNLFYDDYTSGYVYEATTNGSGGFNTPATLASTSPQGSNYIAVDAYGNVFFVDSANASLYEIPWNGTSYGSATPLVSGLASYAVGMGLDSLDNFYVQDSSYDLEEYSTPLATQSSSAITVTSTPPPTSSSGPGGTYTVTATAPTCSTCSSATSTTVSIDPTTIANCTASGYTVTFIASGTCTVDITRGGDGTYAPYQSSQTFVIGDANSNAVPNGATSPSTYGPLLAADPAGNGYWVATNSGVVVAYGIVTSYGSESHALNAPIVGIVATNDGKGYWLFGADGGVFGFGDATFYGSEGDKVLNAPIVGMIESSKGMGYWLVGKDGGVFSFGDATFYGSEGDKVLNAPIVGIELGIGGSTYALPDSTGTITSF